MSAAVGTVPKVALVGAALTLLNTLIGVMADASAKDLVSDHAAPQLMALSGGLAVLLGLSLAAAGQQRMILATATPGRVVLRSCLGAVSTLGFFLALRELPFAELFPFMAMMPIMGAALSALILREQIAPRVWIALACGMTGMLLLFPDGLNSLKLGHGYGLGASLAGSASIVLSRGICRTHTHAFAQVFYAQLACATLGFAALPFVWRPIPFADLGLLAVYTGFLLLTRWLLVVIVRLIPAYVAMQIANVQFIWMVLIGHYVFAESTGAHVWLGAGLIVASGIWIVQAQRQSAPLPAQPVPAE